MINYLDLLNKKYKLGARGPEEFDCYGLIIELYKRRNIKIPAYISAENLELINEQIKSKIPEWKQIEKQDADRIIINNNRELFIKKDCVIIFKVGQFGCHIGYVLNDLQFIHTWQKSCGVSIERIDLWKHKIMGCYDYV